MPFSSEYVYGCTFCGRDMKKVINILAVLSMVWIFFSILEKADSSPAYTGGETTLNSYVTATGRTVSLNEFHGGYLWVDYAAEWCGYCVPQTHTIKSLEKRFGDNLLFITVVTGTGKVMESPTADTARQWADRFDLDPEHVLARFFTDTLPHHVLYSPQGKELFRGSGLFSAEKIEAIIETKTGLVN